MTLMALASRMGILPRYRDNDGVDHETSKDTAAALLRAMGIDPDTAADRLCAMDAAPRMIPEWIVVTPDISLQPPLDDVWHLTHENGDSFEGRGGICPLPIGRHKLEQHGQVCWLLCAPATLPLPPRGWGVTLPLYGLRGRSGAGLGDYSDLCIAAKAIGRMGGGFVGINPVHAGFPTDAMGYNPYAPSHRRRHNVAHIAWCKRPTDAQGPLIDYISVAEDMQAHQKAAFETAPVDRAFVSYQRQEGPALQKFATHQALSDHYGPYWGDWPKAYQDPASDAVAQFAAAHPRAIRFHAWLQWQADLQLSQVAKELRGLDMAQGLYLDLAVGTHIQGAETWEDRDQFAKDVSLGVPPDAAAPAGQTWGLAPFNPLSLIEDGFAALAMTLRFQLRHAGMLRIDHILGFDRAFWVPRTARGGYVRMPCDAMLAVARIEAARANAVLVGADLGNVDDGLRAAMTASGILGCAITSLEHDLASGGGFRPAATYPQRSVAAFGTHDLPPFSGWCKGADIEARLHLGHLTAQQAGTARDHRKTARAALEIALEDADIHGFLAQSGSQLAAVQIEDILGVEMQANISGTTFEYPNWRQRLPIAAADFQRDPRLNFVAETMRRYGR